MTPRCDHHVGGAKRCGTPLTVTVHPSGIVTYTCHRCAWRAAGQCWACGRPRTNHPRLGVYCVTCKPHVVRGNKARHQQSDERRAYLRAWQRAKAASDPAWKARRSETNRQWRERNPDRVWNNWVRFKQRRILGQEAA